MKIIVDGNKKISEVEIHARSADIKTWKTTTVPNLTLPSCLTSTSPVQWSKTEFAVFGFYDPQSRSVSNYLLQFKRTKQHDGTFKWTKTTV